MILMEESYQIRSHLDGLASLMKMNLHSSQKMLTLKRIFYCMLCTTSNMNKSYYWKPSITTLFKVDAKILSAFSESILQFPIIKNMEPPINGGTSFRWSFGSHSAWGSIESTTTQVYKLHKIDITCCVKLFHRQRIRKTENLFGKFQSLNS